jgi:hypothetical protein
MGVWNAYFFQQTNFWGHKFSMPKFPLSNPYSGFKILWLNALSLFTGIIGGLYLVKNAYSILYSKKRATDKLMVLSAAYLVLIVTINLFFSPQWVTGTTNIMGTNRYIFASPFFFVFLANYIEQGTQYRYPHFIAMFFLSSIFWLLFGSYDHIRHWLLFEVNTVLLFLYMQSSNKSIWPSTLLIVFNVFIQIGLFQIFIGGKVLPE